MKLIKYNLGLILCCFAFFVGACSDDDDSVLQTQNGTIKFEKTSNEPVIAYPGDELNFSVNMTATAGIKKVVTILENEEIAGSAKEYPDNTEKESYAVSYTVQDKEVGQALIFVIQAFDRDGRKSTAEYIVYIQAAKPNINISIPAEAPETVTAGDVIQFDVNVTSEFGFKYIKTYLGGNELTDLNKDVFSDPNSDIYTFSYTTTEVDGAQTLTFTFEVMNENGSVVRSDYQVAVERAVVLDINEFYDLKMGAHLSTDFGPFMNAITGDIYVKVGSTAKSADIDIMVFYSANGAAAGYYFIAPANTDMNTTFGGTNNPTDPITSWPTRNDTKLKNMAISSSDFLAINSKAAIKTLYDSSSEVEVSKSAKLAIGSTVAFKTVDDKYGIMILRAFASGSSKGNITFDMKVEK